MAKNRKGNQQSVGQIQFSLFKNNWSDTPMTSLTLEKFVDGIRDGLWIKAIKDLRSKKDSAQFKKLKNALPVVTVSGLFKTRQKTVKFEQRLLEHSGLICIDIDKKDNPRMRVQDLIDNSALCQFTSCSGEGVKVIYRCTPTSDPSEHKRIFDAVIKRLEDKGVKIKVDPVVKSIASLQYVSYDPEVFYNPKTSLLIKPLAPPKVVKRVEPSKDVEKEVEQLEAYLEALNGKDITKDYESWLLVMFGLSYSLGESGREIMHKICSSYKNYSKVECDEKYDSCLIEDQSNVERPVTIATVFQMLMNEIPKLKLKGISKKFSKGHAVGVGEDSEQGDLSGLVRYKLFLFKKVFDKETHQIIDLLLQELNLNAFEKMLRDLGFYRYDKLFIHIQDNIVEQVDIADILRTVTTYIESDGDYKFTYHKVEYLFTWEEVSHLWRKVRGLSTTFNQIASCLTHWKADLVKDTATESFIPFKNGVLRVNKSEIQLLNYADIKQQIWKERILPRVFKATNKKGMFEEFFANVCGRGKDFKSRTSSDHYKRSLWYFGYMLQGSKRQATARAWLLYDIRSGNNGRSGKTIIGQAVGKIRSVVVLDGKQIDFKNRFAFQTVLPWTDVVFIDDPSRFMSLNPLYNIISGELSAEKKNLNPIATNVKVMVASNWILEAEGTSDLGRQFVTQLDDFYVQYAKSHNDTITPLIDYHGKEFFTDWSEVDWSEFDNFCARAIQFHLSSAAPKNSLIGNSALVRFIQLNEEELFFELANAFKTHVKKGEDGRLFVPLQLLVGVVKDAKVNQPEKAGRVVREFLRAIGGGSVEMGNVKIGNISRPVYLLNCTEADIDFGAHGKNIGNLKLK